MDMLGIQKKNIKEILFLLLLTLIYFILLCDILLLLREHFIASPTASASCNSRIMFPRFIYRCSFLLELVTLLFTSRLNLVKNHLEPGKRCRSSNEKVSKIK